MAEKKAGAWIHFTGEDIQLMREQLAGNLPAASILRKLDATRKRIKPASAKGKGRALQQWICKEIAGLLGVEYEQSDDQCPIHSREMGQAGVDVILRPPVSDMLPLDIESKSVENFSLTETVKQARANRSPRRHWIIVTRNKTLLTPVVIMSWGTFVSRFQLGSWRDGTDKCE